MRLKSFLIFICVPFSIAFAQKKVTFHSINMAGIAAGNNGVQGVLQTVNGIGYKDWFAGIGAGIDDYKDRSIPLFIDIRRALTKTGLYAFGDLGYNFPSHNTPGKEVYYYTTYHYTGGLYSDLGMGYKVLLARKTSLLFSTSYSYKELNSNVSVTLQCLVAPCGVDYSQYRYGYGRIVVKAGLEF